MRCVVELIPGRFVRKCAVTAPVLRDVCRLAPDDGRLDQQEDAGVPVGVVNVAGHHRLPRAAVGAGPQRRKVDHGLDAEVFANATNDVAEVIERNVGIGAAVRGDHVAAVPANQLVERHVLEVSAVRKKHSLRADA